MTEGTSRLQIKSVEGNTSFLNKKHDAPRHPSRIIAFPRMLKAKPAGNKTNLRTAKTDRYGNVIDNILHLRYGFVNHPFVTILSRCCPRRSAVLRQKWLPSSHFRLVVLESVPLTRLPSPSYFSVWTKLAWRYRRLSAGHLFKSIGPWGGNTKFLINKSTSLGSG